MNKRGVLWLVLGIIIWICGGIMAQGRYYWWELPLYVLGVLVFIYGAVRNSQGEA